MNERVPDVMPTVMMSKDVGELLSDVRMDVDMQGVTEYLSGRGMTNEEIEALTIEFMTEDSDTEKGKVTYGHYDRGQDRIRVFMTLQLKHLQDEHERSFDPSTENNLLEYVRDEVDKAAIYVQGMPEQSIAEVRSSIEGALVSSFRAQLGPKLYNIASEDTDNTLVHEFEHCLLRDDSEMERANLRHHKKAKRKALALLGTHLSLGAGRIVGAGSISSMDGLYSAISNHHELLTVPSRLAVATGVYALLGIGMKPIKKRLAVDDFLHEQYLANPEERQAREVADKNERHFVTFAAKKPVTSYVSGVAGK